jgi:hypothetical protein
MPRIMGFYGTDGDLEGWDYINARSHNTNGSGLINSFKSIH